jgi:hypothetical protein
MRRQATNTLVAAFLAAAAAATGFGSLGCGPDSPDEIPDDAADRYADAMCETYERCDCMGEVFADADSCRSESIATFRRVKDWPGVAFDDACFEDVLDFIKANDCGSPPNVQPTPCEVFKGTVPRGGSCKAEWSFEGPAGGLTSGSCENDGICSGGTCRDVPGILVPRGAPCRLELGVKCEQIDYCASDGTCREGVPSGAQCDTPLACADVDEYCAGLSTSGGTGICSERAGVGETCNQGEVQSCAPGFLAYCSSAGICKPEWPSICRVVAPPTDAYDPRKWVPF